MGSVQLNCFKDISGTFPYIEKSVNRQPVLLIAYLVLAIFAGLVPGASFFAQAIGGLIFLSLACDLIRSVFSDIADPAVAEQLAMRHGGPPLLSLAFLWVVYYVATLALTLLLIAPGIWWTVSSSLAIAYVCIDDFGAIHSIKLSHQTIRGRFWESFRYLAGVFCLTMLPFAVLSGGMDAGVSYLQSQPIQGLVVLAAALVDYLLRAVFFFLAQMLMLSCIVRLYVHLQEPVAAPVSEAEPESAT